MNRAARKLLKPSSLLAVVAGCALAAGCNRPSAARSADQTSLNSATPEICDGLIAAPLPLQRVAPPDLVQLTEFRRDQAITGDGVNGPQLIVPPLPSSVATHSQSVEQSQSGIGETFKLSDEEFGVGLPQKKQLAIHCINPIATAEAEAGTCLPWGPSTPSSEMTAIAQHAEETARRGYELAQRGGLYSARAKFTESLRMLAEALDSQRHTTAHTKSLAAGLRALDEVDDFVPRGGQIESAMNMSLIVDAHRTPVLKAKPLNTITPLVAQRVYLTYAQEQLAAAGGDQAVASLALHGLGKICITPAEMNGPRVRIAEAKAVVYFQAAVIIEPRNFLSANELGVLLAKFGRLEDARHAVEQAVANSNSPTAWRNLATINERLGDPQKAAICRQRVEAIAQTQPAGPNSANSQFMVRWVDQETFAQSNSMTPSTPLTAAPSAVTTAAPPSPPAAPITAAKPDAKPSGWKWPWQ